MRRLMAACVCAAVMAGCGSSAPTVVEGPTREALYPTRLPGVDSVFVALAERYAVRSAVADDRRGQAAQAMEGGRRLLALADSLLERYTPLPEPSATVTEADEARAVEHFNAGARQLQGDNPGIEALREAAEHFREALAINPYDTEAHYWLSQVYEMQYARLGDMGAVDEAISVLDRLVEMHPHRHDYTALLATAYEASGSEADWRDAGALWHRAALLVEEDALLALDTLTVLDTTSAFIYQANASRAFAEGGQGDMALAALQEAAHWARSDEDLEYVAAEEVWLTWDSVLANRKRYDHLLDLVERDAPAAIRGLEALATQVTSQRAKWDVAHQRALSLFNSGQSTLGIEAIQILWEDIATVEDPLRDRVREDYGIMAYSIGLERRDGGELRAAVAYLLQAEATGYTQAPTAALTLALLFRNDPEASVEAALRAEDDWEALSTEEQRTLLQLMVENYRRLGDREAAGRYADRYRRLR